MDLLIVSGLSGAGKSVAMNALEDIGFFCIDNVPAELLPSITAFSKAGDNQLKRVALSMDVRGCHTSEQIEQALHQLDEQGIEYEILFIDAPDDVLMRRYSETRRRHPISIAEGISTREALAKERQILQPFRERADYTINTEFLSTAQNKERICNLFAPDGGAKAAMRLTVMSFGFKFGIRRMRTWCWMSAACPTLSISRSSSIKRGWMRKWWILSWVTRRQRNCCAGTKVFWSMRCPSMSRRGKAS